MSLGLHILVEFYDCNIDLIDDQYKVEELLNESARQAKATIVNSTFHKFSPQGVSGVVVIAESHFAIHTWPEHGYAAVDFFTCSETMNWKKAYDFLKDSFQAKSADFKIIQRGESLSTPVA